MDTTTQAETYRSGLELPLSAAPLASRDSIATDKLGLSLAGGGFRASLFHLGVLRRLAELDVLRHVQVLSTVSGGSIIGAIYVLRLKAWLERHPHSPNLTAEDYVRIVTEVDEILCRGIAGNLRGRLLLNPLRVLRVICTPISLGGAMAKLYERHMLREALERRPGEQSWQPSRKKSDLSLDQLMIRPPAAEKELEATGVTAYNRRRLQTDRSAFTSLILNATSLNSGGRFFFSGVELGDWYLGFFRRDEFAKLSERRRLLEMSDALFASEFERASASLKEGSSSPELLARARLLSLASWWRQISAGKKATTPAGWEALFNAGQEAGFPGEIPTCAFGALRQAKVGAWYLHEADPMKTGGRTRQEWWRLVCGALGDVDRRIAGWAEDDLHGDSDADPVAALLLEFLIEVYLLRSARRASRSIEGDWRRLSISDAVGASACFPPVFPPFTLLGLYDDGYVRRLGLTDGGVYDNMGVIALLDEGCTSIIASDTGGVFEDRNAAPKGRVLMTAQLPSIFMRALGGLQRLELRERKRVCDDLVKIDDKLATGAACADCHTTLGNVAAKRRLNDLAYFHVTTQPPALEQGDSALEPPLEVDARTVARLRTDLDGFSDIEMAALINRGYDTADRFVRGYVQVYRPKERDKDGRIVGDWNRAVPRTPAPRVRGAHVDAVLEAGSSLFFRAVRLRAPWTLFALALVGVAAVYAATIGWNITSLWPRLWPPMREAIYALPSFTRWIPEIVIPFIGKVLTARAGLAIMGFVLLALLFVPRAKPVVPHERGRFVPVRTVLKWAGSLVWNILWFVWALPLLIALATSAIMLVSWVVFYWPWRAAARIRSGDVPRAGSLAD